MTRIFTTLFFVSLFSIVSAQKFLPGYIVRNNTKTNGFISFEPSKTNRNTILFKTTENESPQTLTADDIGEFFLETVNVVLISVRSEKDSSKIFAEVIRRGLITLASIDKTYFLINNEQVHEVKLPLRSKDPASKLDGIDRKLLEVKEIGKIRNFLPDCDVKLSELSKSSLARYIDSYNQCKSSPSTSFMDKRVRVGLVAGYNVSKLTFNAVEDFDIGMILSKVNFKPSGGFTVGFALDLLSSRKLDKTNMSLGIIYTRNEYSGSKVFNTGSGPETDKHELYFKIGAINFPFAMRRYFQLGQEGLFVSLGITPFFPVGYSQYHKIKTYESGVLTDTRKYNNSLSNRGISASIPFVVGYELKLKNDNRLQFSTSFEYSLGPLTPSAAYSSRILMGTAMVSYKL